MSDLTKEIVALHKASDLLNEVMADHMRRAAVGAQPGRVLTPEEITVLLSAISDAERLLRGQGSVHGKCWCLVCNPVSMRLIDGKLSVDGGPFGLMTLCPKCGNKRCPHATFHENPCTGSNAPGQPGSVY